MIQLKSVTKSFGKLLALDNISLDMKKGECIALIGPNGSGKTTLIKSILGMVVINKGEILFNGKSTLHNESYRSAIGYMPQTGRYPDNMTIGQVFHMLKDIRKKENKILDEELYVTFGLENIKNKRMRTLSGGTRQKVSAALTFLFQPEVLILDEPTAGLDPLSSEQLKEKILKEKEKGRLIIITSHILSDLDELVSEIVYMQEGKLMLHQDVRALKAQTGETKLSKVVANLIKSVA